MKRVLIIYYSQSGEVARVAKLFASELESSDAELTIEAIGPKVVYPYPWRSIRRFFDAMPECVLARPPPIHPPQFDPLVRFDLVVIAYPVWFLSPASPIQAFCNSSFAVVLRETDVVTISVSRAMWQQASERMKLLLKSAGAVHRDNIVVMHQGSPLATLISTPRALLFGRQDRLMGIFPLAGVSEEDLARVRRLGSALARKLGSARPDRGSLLQGEPAVSVNRWFVVPELLASYLFFAWAVVLSGLGRIHAGLRVVGVYGFALFLVGLILLGLPLVLLGTCLAYPAIRHRLNAYILRLAVPTGEPASVGE